MIRRLAWQRPSCPVIFHAANRLPCVFAPGLPGSIARKRLLSKPLGGGYKQNGIGRELGEWGYNNYLETKQITRYSGEAWGW